MASSKIAALDTFLQHSLTAENHELKARIGQLEEQLLSTCLREDGTRKTHAEVNMQLRVVIKEARDKEDDILGIVHQVTELLNGTRAYAGRVNVEMHQAEGRSAPQQALETVHNMICDAVQALEELD
jgi:hypothetical protein